MQRPQTFRLLRGSRVQAGGERPQARARGRGPRPERLHCARAEPRVGPGSGARGVEGGGLQRPGWRLRRGHGTAAGGRERAPTRLASAPRVRSRRSAGTRSWQVGGHWGATGPGRPGGRAVERLAVRAALGRPEASPFPGRGRWVLESVPLRLRCVLCWGSRSVDAWSISHTRGCTLWWVSPRARVSSGSPSPPLLT